MKYTVFQQGVLQTNCIVPEKNGKCVLVDIPYMSHEAEKYVSENGLTPVAVLLTHGHFDHCGGVKHFTEALNCPNIPVFVHKNDFPLCQNAANNIWNMPCENCFPTNELKEGVLTIGDFLFEIVETPGHTAGSVCLISENILLSGDTLFCDGIGRTDFAESCPEKMQASLRKLCERAENYTVVCGHGAETTLEREKRLNPYLRFCNKNDSTN